MSFDSICRLCLVLDDIGCNQSIFCNNDSRDVFLAQKIMQLANVQVFEGDGLPPLICRNCLNRVEGFFQFKIQVEKADLFLRQQVCSFQGVSLSSLSTEKLSENVKNEHMIKNSDYVPDSSWSVNVQSFTALQTCDSLSTTVHLTEPQDVSGAIIEDAHQTYLNLTNVDKENEEKSLLNLTHQEERLSSPFEHQTHTDEQNLSIERKSLVREKSINNYFGHFLNRANNDLDFENTNKDVENVKDLYNLDQNKDCDSSQIDECQFKTNEPKSNENGVNNDHHDDDDNDDLTTNETSDKETSKEKPSTVTYCVDCDTHFDNSVNLKKHLAQHTKQPLKCDLCNKTFRQSWYLNLHKRSHSGERPFICSVCSKDFTDKSALNAHIRITHFTERTQVCSFCGKAFKLKKQLDRHERIHTGHQYHRCEICAKLFTQKSNLIKHLVLHSGEKPFPCPVCEKPFAQKDNLNIHVLRHHSQQNPVVCDVCGKVFKNKMTLMGHKKNKHSEDVKHIICEVCGKCFPDRSSLNSHKWVHSAASPIPCDVCGKSYPHARAMRVHKRIVHSEVRKFCCDICGIGFKTGQTLKHHKVVHTGERAFSCEECGRSFGQKTALRTHQRIHSGVEPYSCTSCGESFKWKQTCDKHISKCMGKMSKDNVIDPAMPLVSS